MLNFSTRNSVFKYFEISVDRALGKDKIYSKVLLTGVVLEDMN